MPPVSDSSHKKKKNYHTTKLTNIPLPRPTLLSNLLDPQVGAIYGSKVEIESYMFRCTTTRQLLTHRFKSGKNTFLLSSPELAFNEARLRK